MGNTYKNCQSCGMPLKRDPMGGGTEADGSKSLMYCSHCYVNGQFTQPDYTAGQMQEFVTNRLREMGFPGFLARLFSRNIPKLERWKQ
ncbi:MAG: hypothetical protein EP344_12980 [Bacteroidetes bacterium]|nr:MAG: hypothetical protein EP344_12980 [Bacteroidota bacterium]